MITDQELKNLVIKWGLRDNVVEKDYVLGWILWGIGSIAKLNSYWAFKGGTSLKKCYLETWRFSEDLDFTVLPEGPYKPDDIKPLIEQVLERVYDKVGIDFSIRAPVFKFIEKNRYTEGRIYYKGPRITQQISSIKLDISASEKVIQPTVLRKISHNYSDRLPKPATIRCYAYEEVFAEKLRAMGERGRPRDLYDIVLLFKNVQADPKLIKAVLEMKCKTKGVALPTIESVQNAATKTELISEWKNMLGHQLQTLPPFEDFWRELPKMFNWLNGKGK